MFPVFCMEKRWLWIFGVFLVLSMMFSVSADMIFTQQPDAVYNLGDSISVPITVKAVSPISDPLTMYLICNGKIIDFYKTGVSLGAGEEKRLEGTALLNKKTIGVLFGNCKIKASLGSDYILTEEFEISDSIVVQSKIDKTEYNPGENLIFEGEAFKKNGEGSDGFVKFTVVTGNDTGMEMLETVNNGYFSVNVSLPEDMAAGAYLIKVDVYEINIDGDQTNKGFMNYNIKVNQIPTSLEVILDNEDIEPGTNLRAKTVLHDQTGEPIDAISIITVKKSKNEIIIQSEQASGEYMELPILYNEPPANWTIFAVSSQLSTEVSIVIKNKSEVSIDVVNGTILIKNIGNVPYNDSVFVKIGENSSINIPVFLEVDKSIEYVLNAPDGEYFVEVISNGESKFGNNLFLTGRAIDIKEKNLMNFNFSNTFVWVFIIVILFGVGFLVYKKGYKKSFFGRKVGNVSEPQKVQSKVVSKNEFAKGAIIEAGDKAILSLSIKGDKQRSTFVCLKIRNLGEIKKEGVEETMKRVSVLAEKRKAFIYENQENIFFILSAIKTKTFQNEKAAIELAKDLQEVLDGHNRLFKYKIDFGISITDGEIVSKINSAGDLEFMGMGNIIASSKKIANISKGEILLSKGFKEKAGGLIKPDEKTIDGTKVYTIREMRNREQHAEFISNFLHGLERDKKEKERREKK